MSIKVNKKSKLFAESLEIFKSNCIEEISPIETQLLSLKESVSEITGNNHKENLHHKKLSEILNNLENTISSLKGFITTETGKLIKDYSWLKNKFGILEDERKNFKILYELSSVLEKETELDKLLQAVIDSLTMIVNAEYGVVELIDDKGNVRLAKEIKSKNNNAALLEMKDKVLDAVIDSGSSIIMNSMILKSKSNGDKQKYGSVLCLPLKSDETIIGTMYFGTYKKNFTSDETDIAEALSERVTQAIENNIKYNQLIESRQKMLVDLRAKYDFSKIIGNSFQMATVLSTVADIAESNTAVLIIGESGTGKEVIAWSIHNNSHRKNKPFIPINCSAIPETLLESELFGYEKGAFTGAVNRKPGKFELADGGTILLDEIGELSTTLQVKLLRFLQSHEFELLGSNKVVKSDVRIISATKRDLSKMVEEGKFRDDLYYRINVINIHIPPLRERQGDIPPLVNHFMQKYAAKNNKEIEGITKEALNFIELFRFPGNIRELENVIERAVVLSKNKILTLDDLPDNIKSPVDLETDLFPHNSSQLNHTKKKLIDESIGPLEKNFITHALRKTGGNVSEAARITQMHRKQFQRLMSRYDLKPQDVLN